MAVKASRARRDGHGCDLAVTSWNVPKSPKATHFDSVFKLRDCGVLHKIVVVIYVSRARFFTIKMRHFRYPTGEIFCLLFYCLLNFTATVNDRYLQPTNMVMPWWSRP
ncbi:unnamed protein product [Linum trigynum]|uniref:Uncharacterized protein n=1 Tax=Linum trigynum TaxID=586398 RepID=A0AAV2CY26_9ROSI